MLAYSTATRTSPPPAWLQGSAPSLAEAAADALVCSWEN